MARSVLLRDLVAKIVYDTRMDTNVVNDVCQRFLNEIQTVIVRGNSVNLRNFGKFHSTVKKSKYCAIGTKQMTEYVKFSVKFTKSYKFIKHWESENPDKCVDKSQDSDE